MYAYDTLLERLPQDLEDMAAALGPFIEKEHPMVRLRHVAGQRHLTAADQPHIGDRLMRPPLDPRRTPRH